MYYIIDQINGDLRKFAVNMIPYPSMHFFISSFAPLSSQYHSLTLPELTKEILDTKNMMVICDPRLGRYLSIATIFRGEILNKEVAEEMVNMQQNHYFYYDIIKTSLSKIPTRGLETSAALIGKIHTRMNPNNCHVFSQVIIQLSKKSLNISSRNFQQCFVEKLMYLGTLVIRVSMRW